MDDQCDTVSIADCPRDDIEHVTVTEVLQPANFIVRRKTFPILIRLVGYSVKSIGFSTALQTYMNAG